MINRRQFTQLCIASLMGCGPSKRPQHKIYQSNTETTPQLEQLVDTAQFSTTYTTVSQQGEYLVGTVQQSSTARVHLLFEDDEGQPVQIFATEFSPKVFNGVWAIPLANLSIRHKGAMKIKQIYTIDSQQELIGKEQVNIPISVPETPNTYWLPSNNAMAHQVSNVQLLLSTTKVLVHYYGKDVVVKNSNNNAVVSPTFIVPIGSYNDGIQRNTEIVQRASAFYIHSTKPFIKSPLQAIKWLTIDEVYGGGAAYPAGQVRVGKTGTQCGIQQSSNTSTGLLDIHECAHVFDEKKLGPTDDYHSISYVWHPPFWEKKPGQTIDHVFTQYSLTNHLEDFADTVAHAAIMNEHVVNKMNSVGTRELREKYKFVKNIVFGGKEYSVVDVEAWQKIS